LINKSLPSFDQLPISESDKERLKNQVTTQIFEKNSTVIHQGEVCKKVFFIRKGLVKLSYITREGKEFIKSFIQEGEMLGSLYSQLRGGGSTFNAIAIEELEVDSLDYNIFQQLIQENPTLQRFALVFFQQLALKKEIREYEFLCLSAQQRYEKFCEQQPDLIQRIRQADMALYLGITPIALSRMKNRATK